MFCFVSSFSSVCFISSSPFHFSTKFSSLVGFLYFPQIFTSFHLYSSSNSPSVVLSLILFIFTSFSHLHSSSFSSSLVVSLSCPSFSLPPLTLSLPHILLFHVVSLLFLTFTSSSHLLFPQIFVHSFLLPPLPHFHFLNVLSFLLPITFTASSHFHAASYSSSLGCISHLSALFTFSLIMAFSQSDPDLSSALPDFRAKANTTRELNLEASRSIGNTRQPNFIFKHTPSGRILIGSMSNVLLLFSISPQTFSLRFHSLPERIWNMGAMNGIESLFLPVSGIGREAETTNAHGGSCKQT